MNIAESQPILAEELEKQAVQERQYQRSALIVLLSITALLCSGLELAALLVLDGMLRFMTVREILWDVGVAFIPLFGIAVGWCRCLMLFTRIIRTFAWKAFRPQTIFWRLCLAVPLLYFVLELANSTRLRVSPHW